MTKHKIMQHMHDNIPYKFNCWADPVVHLIILKSSMVQTFKLYLFGFLFSNFQLYSYFEDSNFVYIILELCRRRSMMELHKRRKAVTEPETRYFMNQILLGVKYLHENKIIHRDLKLGNIFLNDNMEVKIGFRNGHFYCHSFVISRVHLT